MKQLLLLLLTVLSFVGCRTAEDAFNDGRQAEMSGNHLRAVQFYIETIRLENTFPAAQERLSSVSTSLMEQNVHSTRVSLDEHNGRRALSYINKAEGLKRIVAPYVSSIALPHDWSTLKANANQLVVSEIFAMVLDAENNGQWDSALGHLNEINKYRPNSKARQNVLNGISRINDKAYQEQLKVAATHQKGKRTSEALNALESARKYADSLKEKNQIGELADSYRNEVVFSIAGELKNLINQKKFVEAEKKALELDKYQNQFGDQHKDATRLLKAKVYTAWAKELYNQKKYRQAWERGHMTLKFDPDNKDIAILQKDAIQRGRVNFVVLPNIHNRNSEELCRKIDGAFNNGPYRNMTPFTAVTRDFDLQDAIRALRLNPQRISREQAMKVAKRTHASFVIFREITQYRLEKKFTGSRSEAIKRKDKTATSLTIKSGQFKLISTMRISVIDAVTGHLLIGEEIVLDNTINFEQALPSEDPKKLVLSAKQAALMQPPGDAEDMAVLEKKAADTAAAFFTDKLLPKMEKLVP